MFANIFGAHGFPPSLAANMLALPPGLSRASGCSPSKRKRDIARVLTRRRHIAISVLSNRSFSLVAADDGSNILRMQHDNCFDAQDYGIVVEARSVGGTSDDYSVTASACSFCPFDPDAAWVTGATGPSR